MARLKTISREVCPPFLWNLARRVRQERPIRAVSKTALMSWMGFINPGMLSDGNLALIDYCVKHLPNEAPAIEIGSFAGKSLNHLILLLRRAGRANRVFSVDDWNFEGYQPGGTIEGLVSFDAYRTHVVDTFEKNVRLFSGDRLPYHIEANSDAFFAMWASHAACSDYFGRSVQLGGPISFAYIDGNHTYIQSKKDFENVDRHLEPYGFIVFDDSADGSGW
jgi:hypothetical protein